MKRKLRQDEILKTEEAPLSADDLTFLLSERKRQALLLLSGYVPLTGILLYELFFGGSRYASANETRMAMFQKMLPYVCGFIFLALTIYFLIFYLQSLAPILRDIRQGKKHLLYYIPQKYEMALFSKYYLSSPVMEQRDVSISREDFNIIRDNDAIVLEVAPHSCSILRFSYYGKEIKTH